MPKDIRLHSKKRQHPSDGFLLASSASKKPSSFSEPEPDSSIDSARNSAAEYRSDSGNASFWNSISGAGTSDCSAAVSVSRSLISTTNVANSKHGMREAVSSDAASHDMEASQSPAGLLLEAGKEDLWMYRAPFSKCESSAADSEHSEVTYARASVAERERNGGPDSARASHVISRREKSSLNPKWDTDAAWYKDLCGSDAELRQKQREYNKALLNASESRGFRSMVGSESSSSCDTDNRFVKEIRPKHGFSYSHGSLDKLSSVASSNALVRVEGFAGPSAMQERSGSFGYLNTRHAFAKEGSNSSSLTEGKMDSITPSYVLSSGRLSLEEEARMGRRASTIDLDFEEYFSSLMLE